MGLTLTVRFSGSLPTWADISQRLAAGGYPVQMRMIDGQLAFPDEQPGEPWQELRLGTPGGMVTLRRGLAQIECVIWGNADAGLRQGWHALALAAALAGNGQVETESGLLSPTDFVRQVDLPVGWQS